jgi:hypothetical protein
MDGGGTSSSRNSKRPSDQRKTSYTCSSALPRSTAMSCSLVIIASAVRIVPSSPPSFSWRRSDRKSVSSVMRRSRTSAWRRVSRGSFDDEEWSVPSLKTSRLRVAPRERCRVPVRERRPIHSRTSAISKVERSPPKLMAGR